MFWSLSSYVLVLFAFVEFVVWNGGVVLGKYFLFPNMCILSLQSPLTHVHAGDKENHIASLHLAQMLYIWPYFFFFSFPLLAPYLLNAILPQTYLPQILQTGSLRSYLPRIIIATPILASMLAIVHYNTIVHSFALADNRHYMFYIFRILLRHPYVKYLAVPIYFAAAWTCLIAPGLSATTQQNATRPSQPAHSRLNDTRVSFSLVWLITTALSLCSAPLVEPRYLIVPWLIWRMHIVCPTPAAEDTTAKSVPLKKRGTPSASSERPALTESLWLETVWFLLIDFATGYIFLHWGFEWPQEPAKVQRFLW